MINFDFIENNKRVIDIQYKNIFKKNKKIIVYFTEPSFYEVVEFVEIAKDLENLTNWLIQFIEKKVSLTKKDKIFIKSNIDKLYLDFFKLYVKLPPKRYNKNNEDEFLYSSYLITLSQDLNIDPITLMKNYTRRQIDYFSQWSKYLSNYKAIKQLEWLNKKTWKDISTIARLKAENHNIITMNKMKNCDFSKIKKHNGRVDNNNKSWHKTS